MLRGCQSVDRFVATRCRTPTWMFRRGKPRLLPNIATQHENRTAMEQSVSFWCPYRMSMRKCVVGFACLLVAGTTYLLIQLPIPQLSVPTPAVRKPPDCLAPSNTTVVGGILKFFVPESVAVYGSDGPDASIYRSSTPDGKAMLRIGEGVMWIEHADEFQRHESNRQLRHIFFDDWVVVEDVTVVGSDGKRSRLISTISESAMYESAPPEAASFFDSVLDTKCFNDLRRPENRRGEPLLLDCSQYVLRPFGEKRCIAR